MKRAGVLTSHASFGPGDIILLVVHKVSDLVQFLLQRWVNQSAESIISLVFDGIKESIVRSGHRTRSLVDVGKVNNRLVVIERVNVKGGLVALFNLSCFFHLKGRDDEVSLSNRHLLTRLYGLIA